MCWEVNCSYEFRLRSVDYWETTILNKWKLFSLESKNAIFFLKCKWKVWNVVEFGWSSSKELDRESRLTNVIKPKLE